MAFWQLSGGQISGAQSLDALGITNAQLSLGSLVEDRLTFSQVFKDAGSVQEIGNLQKVTLWRDGVRYFTGWVTNQRARDTSDNGLQIDTTVSGVWWWLEQTPLSGMAKGSDNGTEKERIAFGFAQGDLRAHIIAVIDRAKILGVDINVGGISSCYNVPQITLKQMSCADALVELMRFIPDAVSYINYSGVTPTFNVKRRGVAATETLTVGQPPCSSIDINPRLELETSQVTVSYVDRGVTGVSIFKDQTHGTASNGKRQILTVSGPELDTYLPNDLFDTYSAQTVGGGSVETAALAKLSSFDAAKTAGLTNELEFDTYTGTFYPNSASVPTQSNPEHYSLPAVQYTTPSGQSVDPSGKHVLISETPPEWMTSEHGLTEVVISGWWWYLHTNQQEDPAQNLPEPAWHDDLPGVQALKSGYMAHGVFAWTHNTLYGAQFEFTAWLVDEEYASETTIYRKADYGFVQPPVGFAQGLLETQDFIPYEGTVTTASHEAGAHDVRGRCLNITGSLSSHANMKALVQGVTMDLQTGSTSIELGVSKRLSFLGLVQRFRRTASDNIIWLNGSGSLGGDPATGGGQIGTSGTSGGSTSTDDGTGDTGATGISFGYGGSGGFGDGSYGGGKEEEEQGGGGTPSPLVFTVTKSSRATDSHARVYTRITTKPYSITNVPADHKVTVIIQYGNYTDQRTFSNGGATPNFTGWFIGTENILSEGHPYQGELSIETTEFPYTVNISLVRISDSQVISTWNYGGNFVFSGTIGDSVNVQGESNYSLTFDVGNPV